MDAQTSRRDERLDAVLKTALDAVVVMGSDGTIAGWNDVAEQTFGWTAAEVEGRRMSEVLIPERYREAHERGLAHYLATGEGPVLGRRIEIEAINRAGDELPVELSITPTEQFGETVFLGFLRDISERRDAARRQELLIAELNHRAKNLLGVVSGIAHQSARGSSSLDEFIPAFAGRLACLGRAHEILTARAWEDAPFGEIVEALLGPYATGSEPRVSFAGPKVLLAPRQLLSVSMVLHELITNAVKYGALSTPAGRIALAWSVDDGQVRIKWQETGLESLRPPTRRGFGTRMIELSVRHDLRGTSVSNWEHHGLRFELTFSARSSQVDE